MAEGKIVEFTAGWLFWSIVFFVVVGPFMYITWKFTNDDTFIVMRVGVGIMAAAVGAGFVSWAVNSVFQWYYKRQRRVERKKTKKQKQRR